MAPSGIFNADFLPFAAVISLALVVSQLLLVAHAAEVEIPADADIPGGGWRRIEPNKNDVSRLTTALRSEYNYRATVKSRVCLFSLDMVYEQDFAAGANFQYHGYACQVDSVAGAGLCPNQLHTYDLCNMYDIRVFEPKGTVNASQVLMIDYTIIGAPKDTLDVLNSSLPTASSESPTQSSAPSPLSSTLFASSSSMGMNDASADGSSRGPSRVNDTAAYTRRPPVSSRDFSSSSASPRLKDTALRDSAAEAALPSVWLLALVVTTASICITAAA